MSAEKPRRLGRGLEALISGAVRTVPEPASEFPKTTPSALRIADIRPNPFQPRKDFRPEDLKELEDSLRTTGLLQPITVRPANSGGWELAAGERRLRAATNLGWTEIPATIRDLSDQELLAVALVENLQRADLNPVEEAEGYARLMREFQLTQQAVAEAVGKDRSTIANLLRVLTLPAPVRGMLSAGTISFGHARALLTLGNESDILKLAKEIASSGLSVREVESRVRVRKPAPKQVSDTRTSPGPHNTHLRQIEDQLRRRLQTDSKIAVSGENKGTISISFYSADDLDRLLDLLLGPDRDYR